MNPGSAQELPQGRDPKACLEGDLFTIVTQHLNEGVKMTRDQVTLLRRHVRKCNTCQIWLRQLLEKGIDSKADLSLIDEEVESLHISIQPNLNEFVNSGLDIVDKETIFADVEEVCSYKM